MTIVPRWEWRIFGESFGPAEDVFASLDPESVMESDELYVLSRASDASVKVREGLMDVKRRLAVDDDGPRAVDAGAEVAVPAARGGRPLRPRRRWACPPRRSSAIRTRATRSPPSSRALGCWRSTSASGVSATRSAAAWPSAPRCGSRPGPRARSRSSQRTRNACPRWSASSGSAVAAVTCVARGLKALAGFRGRRLAVIDVGTNSVKFHVAEQDAAGDVPAGPRPRRGHPAGRRAWSGRDGSARRRSSAPSTRSRPWPRRRAATGPRRSSPSARPGFASRPTRRSSSTRCATAPGSRSR